MHINQILDAPFFCPMPDESIDLTLVCHWVENGPPDEHFMGIVPLKKGNAKSIYSTLTAWLKKNNIQCCKLDDMGFDGAETLVGK